MEEREYATMFSVEENYWWYRSLRRRIHAALRRGEAARSRRLSPQGPKRCLDAGCGSGMFLTSLAQPWIGIGCDASTTPLRFARRRGLRHLACASVEALPFASDSFQSMVSADVLYHRGVHDDVAALREMTRCLAPEGILVLNLPAFAWLRSTHDEAIHTARRYTTGEVRRKLRAAGLTPLRVRYWNWLLFGPLAIVRLIRRWRPSAEPPASDLRPLPNALNGLLDFTLKAEERLAGLPVPFGLSVIAEARKE